jgi:hypothetical protein
MADRTAVRIRSAEIRYLFDLSSTRSAPRASILAIRRS